MIQVNLTESELLLCEMLGRMRTLTNRHFKVKDKKFSNRKGYEIDVDGIIAEYAFSKHFNTFPDLVTDQPRKGGCDGILKGFKYDVKSSRNPSSPLISRKEHNPDVDMYCLCIINESQVDIIGYALKEDLIRSENIRKYNKTEVFELRQEKLRTFKD